MGCINTKVTYATQENDLKDIVVCLNNLHWQTVVSKTIGEHCLTLAKCTDNEAFEMMNKAFARVCNIMETTDPAYIEAERLMKFITSPPQLYGEAIAAAAQHAMMNQTTTFNKVVKILVYVIKSVIV